MVTLEKFANSRFPRRIPKRSVGSDGQLSREPALKGGSGQEEPFEKRLGRPCSLPFPSSLPLPYDGRLVKLKQQPPSFASQASGEVASPTIRG